MHKTVVINAVGLTQTLLPRMAATKRFAETGRVATIRPVLPAVTCTAQATYLTGCLPRAHGIVGNGWYFRDECEIRFWRQSDKLVQRPRIWEPARRADPSFTCANLFWWHAMYSSADVTVTPRPMYPADGRKLPDLWTNPPELRFELQRMLGQFPLLRFWGPAASIESTRWIANAALHVDRKFDPTLTLIYLPHLDYSLQKLGPDDPRIQKDLNELDDVIDKLLSHYRGRGARIVVLSEYGIEPVSRPVHLNRLLRLQKMIAVREELGRELLDAGASSAFAVADHQIAHVYVHDPHRLEAVRQLLGAEPGVADVLDRRQQAMVGLDHARSGDLVVVAGLGAWFTYYYWLDDDRAPDFARTVDIHRKPGYDPAELFIDPTMSSVKLRIAWALLKRRLGFRTLMSVIPLDGKLVRGSHGRPADDAACWPVLISSCDQLVDRQRMEGADVFDLLMRHLTSG